MWAIHAAIQQNTGAVLPLCSVWLHSPLNLIFFFSPVFAFLCLWQRLSLRPAACSGHAAETVMSLPLKEQPHRTAVSDLFSVVWFYFSVLFFHSLLPLVLFFPSVSSIVHDNSSSPYLFTFSCSVISPCQRRFFPMWSDFRGNWGPRHKQTFKF